MPVIKIHVQDTLPRPANLEPMAQVIHQACVEWLRAKPDAVQLQVMRATEVLRGQPIYIEVHYRAQPYRDAAVMQRFMHMLQSQAQTVFGAVPRIRCMAVEAHLLHALN